MWGLIRFDFENVSPAATQVLIFRGKMPGYEKTLRTYFC